MKEQFFESKGIYYRSNDFRADRKTLIFIHGLSGTLSAWKEYEATFSDDYNLLMYDIRGHGKSKRPADYESYNITHFVEDLKSLIAHYGPKSFTLIGHSYGGMIGLEFLLTYPRMVEAAIFLSPDFHTKNIRFTRFVFPFIGLASAFLSVLPLYHKQGKHLDYVLYKNTGDWNLRRIYADVMNSSFHVYFYCLNQLYSYNRVHVLSTIKCPVLIIHGLHDTVVPPENSRSMARKIPGAELEILNDANHILVLNNIEEVTTLLVKFLKNLNK